MFWKPSSDLIKPHRTVFLRLSFQTNAFTNSGELVGNVLQTFRVINSRGPSVVWPAPQVTAGHSRLGTAITELSADPFFCCFILSHSLCLKIAVINFGCLERSKVWYMINFLWVPDLVYPWQKLVYFFLKVRISPNDLYFYFGCWQSQN